MINIVKLTNEILSAGIKTNGCNVDGIVWDDDNSEIQTRPDVAAIIAAHDPNDYDALGAIVQSHLDTTAQTREYDNADRCVGYVNSTNAVWAAEATAFVAWRDSVFAVYIPLLTQYKAHDLPYPTPAELVASLPEITWPQ